MKAIDARGLSCPQPMILTKQYLDKNSDGCKILVDNPAAKENVIRYAKKAGYVVSIQEENSDILLILSKMS